MAKIHMFNIVTEPRKCPLSVIMICFKVELNFNFMYLASSKVVECAEVLMLQFRASGVGVMIYLSLKSLIS